MRTPSEIVESILKNAIVITWQEELIDDSRISPLMFKKYVNKLVDNGYIIKKSNITKDRRIYYITSKEGEKILKVLTKANQSQRKALRFLDN